MRRQLLAGLGMLLVFTVLTGVVYPLAVTAVAQVTFHDKANGSIVERDGRPAGSELIGQMFIRPDYFHPRPSSAGDGYDAGASSGSNLGPTNPKFLAAVKERIDAFRQENGLGTDVEVPVDAVTASGSGLDPDISVANARLQARRVAQARQVPLAVVMRLVGRHTAGRGLGFLGEPGVNVLELNLALDTLGPGGTGR